MTSIMMPATYSSRAVADATGLTYRQVDNMARCGVLRPSAADADGSGTRRLYDEDDLRIMFVVAALCRHGADYSVLRPAAAALRLRLDLDAWGGVVCVDGEGLLVDGLPECGAGWVLDLDRIERAVDEVA